MTEPAKTPIKRLGCDATGRLLSNPNGPYVAYDEVEQVIQQNLQRIAELEEELKQLKVQCGPLKIGTNVMVTKKLQDNAHRHGLEPHRIYVVQNLFEGECQSGWMVNIDGHPNAFDSMWFDQV